MSCPTGNLHRGGNICFVHSRDNGLLSCFFRTHSESNLAAIAKIRLGCLSSFCTSCFPLAANSKEWAGRKRTRGTSQRTPVLQSKRGQRAPVGTRALGHMANLTTERWGLQIFCPKSTLLHSQINKYQNSFMYVKTFTLGRISSSLFWGMLKQWFHKRNFFKHSGIVFLSLIFPGHQTKSPLSTKKTTWFR